MTMDESKLRELEEKSNLSAQSTFDFNSAAALDFFKEAMKLPNIIEKDKTTLQLAIENTEFGHRRLNYYLEEMRKSQDPYYFKVIQSINFILSGFALGYGISGLSKSAESSTRKKNTSSGRKKAIDNQLSRDNILKRDLHKLLENGFIGEGLRTELTKIFTAESIHPSRQKPSMRTVQKWVGEHRKLGKWRPDPQS